MTNNVLNWPLKLVDNLYKGLQPSDPTRRGYLIKELPAYGTSSKGLRVAISFNFKTTLSASEEICLEVEGEEAEGLNEAGTSAIASLLTGLREEYGIFLADYSYVMITEDRKLYEEMKRAVQALKVCYDRIDSEIGECCKAIFSCHDELSNWHKSCGEGSQHNSQSAVYSFLEWLGANAKKISDMRDETSSAIAMLMSRETSPDSLQRLFNTSPMPMMVDWDASYPVLQALLDETVKLVYATASEITVTEIEAGGYRAAMTVSFTPYIFTGPTGSSPMGAKSKLICNVLRHLEEQIGLHVVDVNHHDRGFMQTSMIRFEGSMELVWQSGKKLARIGTACQSELYSKSLGLTNDVSEKSNCEAVLKSINGCVKKMEIALDNVPQEIINFNNHKVSRGDLEHWLHLFG